MVSWNLMISINVLLYLVCWRIWSYGLELETSTILQTLIISDVKSHKIRHEFGWQSAECWSFDQILLPPGWNKSGDCRFAWQNETFRRLSSTWTIFNHSKSCVIRHLILRNHTKKKTCQRFTGDKHAITKDWLSQAKRSQKLSDIAMPHRHVPIQGPNEITAVGNSSKSAKVSTNLGMQRLSKSRFRGLVVSHLSPLQRNCASKGFHA